MIRETVQRGGSVVVPAFAVERTQKFVFMLKELMEAGQIPRVPVYCDSPMAIKAVEIFMKHTEEYSDETHKPDQPVRFAAAPGRDSLSRPRRRSRRKSTTRITLASLFLPAAWSTGGRILHHLAQRLPDPKNTVIFIGFQAPGTRGFTIKSGAPEVKIFGDMVPIRAQIAAFEQFSDHADPPELLEWLHTFKQKPERDVSGPRRASGVVSAARHDGQGTGMECAGRAVDGRRCR